MTYRTFSILANLNGTVKSFEIVAIDIGGALADLRAAFGDAFLIQYSVR